MKHRGLGTPFWTIWGPFFDPKLEAFLTYFQLHGCMNSRKSLRKPRAPCLHVRQLSTHFDRDAQCNIVFFLDIVLSVVDTKHVSEHAETTELDSSKAGIHDAGAKQLPSEQSISCRECLGPTYKGDVGSRGDGQ